MTAHSLYAHTTPSAGLPEFTFSSKAEKDLYIQFENKLTTPERAAYASALTIEQRKIAAEALAKKRKAVYKMWAERNKPMRGDVA